MPNILRRGLSSLWLRALGFLQSFCKHDGRYVSVDVTEGRDNTFQVAWCRRCGAYRFGYCVDYNSRWQIGEWHEPHAEWWIERKGA